MTWQQIIFNYYINCFFMYDWEALIYCLEQKDVFLFEKFDYDKMLWNRKNKTLDSLLCCLSLKYEMCHAVSITIKLCLLESKQGLLTCSKSWKQWHQNSICCQKYIPSVLIRTSMEVVDDGGSQPVIYIYHTWFLILYLFYFCSFRLKQTCWLWRCHNLNKSKNIK